MSQRLVETWPIKSMRKKSRLWLGMTRADHRKKNQQILKICWLVVTGTMEFEWLSIQLGMSWSQLTKSIIFRGVGRTTTNQLCEDPDQPTSWRSRLYVALTAHPAFCLGAGSVPQGNHQVHFGHRTLAKNGSGSWRRDGARFEVLQLDVYIVW